MTIRNFWLEAEVDGLINVVSGGPRSKDGGMRIRLYMRSEGGSTKVLDVECRAEGDKLVALIDVERVGSFRGEPVLETQRIDVTSKR